MSFTYFTILILTSLPLFSDTKQRTIYISLVKIVYPIEKVIYLVYFLSFLTFITAFKKNYFACISKDDILFIWSMLMLKKQTSGVPHITTSPAQFLLLRKKTLAISIFALRV